MRAKTTRSNGQMIWSITMGFAFAASSIGACVGDGPTASPTTAADDGSTDTTFAGDSPSTTGDSATADVTSISDADTFDGANASCNNIDPTGAPQATVGCVDASVPPAQTGGTIVPGRYRLTSQIIYGGTQCSLANLTPFSDITEVAAGDSGTNFVLTVALDGPFASRHVIQWQVTGTGTLTQSDICPSNANTFPVTYTVSQPTASVHEIQFYLAPSVFVFDSF